MTSSLTSKTRPSSHEEIQLTPAILFTVPYLNTVVTLLRWPNNFLWTLWLEVEWNVEEAIVDVLDAVKRKKSWWWKRVKLSKTWTRRCLVRRFCKVHLHPLHQTIAHFSLNTRRNLRGSRPRTLEHKFYIPCPRFLSLFDTKKDSHLDFPYHSIPNCSKYLFSLMGCVLIHSVFLL